MFCPVFILFPHFYCMIHVSKFCKYDLIGKKIRTFQDLWEPWNTYWEIDVFRIRSKMDFLTIFAKNSVLNLWEGSEYVSGFEYVRVLNIRKFSLMTGFWICVGVRLWKGSEYSRFPCMSGFCVCKHWTRFWICLNMPDQQLTGL